MLNHPRVSFFQYSNTLTIGFMFNIMVKVQSIWQKVSPSTQVIVPQLQSAYILPADLNSLFLSFVFF